MTYPVVLSHGIARFDAAWNSMFHLDNTDNPFLDSFHYFKGIRGMLQRKIPGLQVYHVCVPWAARVEHRAKCLRREVLRVLRRSGNPKVNIIAHSMGGLDVRRMLYSDWVDDSILEEDKIHNHVASLSTIGAPHKGSEFADWGVMNAEAALDVLNGLGIDAEGFRDLTTEACQDFNAKARECEKELAHAGLEFRAYAGKSDPSCVFLPLKFSFGQIAEYRAQRNQEPHNDGLVAVESALWDGSPVGLLDQGIWDNTDHLNELAWCDISQVFAREGAYALMKRIHRQYLQIAKQLP